MKIYGKSKQSRKGSALFTVMMIIMAVTALLAYTTRASLQQVFSAHKLADRIKAGAIAEAGAHDAYHILATNFTERTSDARFPLTSFAGGTYDVTVVPVSNTVAVIHSTGIYGSAHETVILDIKNYGSSSDVSYPPNSFDFSILSGGEIKWSGGSQMLGASLHSNSGFTIGGSGFIEANIESSVSYKSNGNASGVTGDVSAPSISGNLSNISGSKNVQAVPLVQIPDIDLTPYYNHALANGEVRSGNVSLTGGYTPAGGILWVNGTLTIGGNANYVGSFFATGGVNIPGSGAITNPNPYPTIVSRDGDVSFTGDKSVEGLIYVKNGDYKQTAGNILTGQLIVKGDVDKAGGSMIINYVDSTPTPPDDSSNSGDIIGLSAWQK